MTLELIGRHTQKRNALMVCRLIASGYICLGMMKKWGNMMSSPFERTTLILQWHKMWHGKKPVTSMVFVVAFHLYHCTTPPHTILYAGRKSFIHLREKISPCA